MEHFTIDNKKKSTGYDPSTSTVAILAAEEIPSKKVPGDTLDSVLHTMFCHWPSGGGGGENFGFFAYTPGISWLYSNVSLKKKSKRLFSLYLFFSHYVPIRYTYDSGEKSALGFP